MFLFSLNIVSHLSQLWDQFGMENSHQTLLISADDTGMFWAFRKWIAPEVLILENAGCSSCESCCCCVCVNEFSDTWLSKKNKIGSVPVQPPTSLMLIIISQGTTFIDCSCYPVCQRKQNVLMKEGTCLHGCLPHTDSCSNTDKGLGSFTHMAWMHHVYLLDNTGVCRA